MPCASRSKDGFGPVTGLSALSKLSSIIAAPACRGHAGRLIQNLPRTVNRGNSAGKPLRRRNFRARYSSVTEPAPDERAAVSATSACRAACGSSTGCGKIEPRGLAVAAQVNALGVDPGHPPAGAGSARRAARRTARPRRRGRRSCAGRSRPRRRRVRRHRRKSAARRPRSRISGRTRRPDGRARWSPDRGGNRRTRHRRRRSDDARQNGRGGADRRSAPPRRAE